MLRRDVYLWTTHTFLPPTNTREDTLLKRSAPSRNMGHIVDVGFGRAEFHQANNRPTGCDRAVVQACSIPCHSDGKSYSRYHCCGNLSNTPLISEITTQTIGINPLTVAILSG